MLKRNKFLIKKYGEGYGRINMLNNLIHLNQDMVEKKWTINRDNIRK